LSRTPTRKRPARSNLSTTFGPALVAAGEPWVRWHDLRQFAQGYAADSGATVHELIARFG